MTDMEKLKKTFDEIGITYEMSDDSEERTEDEVKSKFRAQDTVVIISQSASEFVAFHFKRNGKFREVFVS